MGTRPLAGFFVLVVGQLVDSALQLAYSTRQLAHEVLQLADNAL